MLVSPVPFRATFSAQALAAATAQDVFEIVAPSDKRVQLTELHLGQYTDFGDAAAEILSLLIIRGFTVASNGTAITPISPVQAVFGGTVLRNGNTLANTGTTVTDLATAWNIQAPFFYSSEKLISVPIILAPSERMVIRLTAPADELTFNGTVKFLEGK